MSEIIQGLDSHNLRPRPREKTLPHDLFQLRGAFLSVRPLQGRCHLTRPGRGVPVQGLGQRQFTGIMFFFRTGFVKLLSQNNTDPKTRQYSPTIHCSSNHAKTFVQIDGNCD